MKTLVKIAALAAGIIATTACSWFSNDTSSIDNQNTQIDTIKASFIDSSKIDTSANPVEKNTTPVSK